MKFIGRKHEIALLQNEWVKNDASLIAIYGRRRVGKTRLIEEFYKDKNLWKFDGLEKQSKTKQINNFLSQLAQHSKDSVYKTAHCKTWVEVFKLLDQAISRLSHKHNITIFFDELPYMANRRREMISELKWAWDNLWSNKSDFSLILCGSVASFMVESVINSSALYGRIKLEICLKPFSFNECRDFMGHNYSNRELLDLYMICGGIPEYLLQIDKSSSVAVNINRLAFTKDGYFTKEFLRIFKDTFYEDRIYKKIIMLFSKYKSLKTQELLEILSMSGGSGFNRYLKNLELAGFIESFVPCGHPKESKLQRHRLIDEYLHFYFKFIQPNLKSIENNTNKEIFSKILTSRSYQSWTGLAFERACLKHINEITRALQIDQLVTDYGPYYNRATNTKDGLQIDLIIERHDPVITICEMKYYYGKIGKWIIDEIEKKISLLPPTKKSIEKILITTEGITNDLRETNYFTRVLLLEDVFGKQ